MPDLKNEIKRMRIDTLKYEREFPEKLKQIEGFVYERNNINDKYTIDHRIRNLKNNEIIAYIDLECRSNDLSKYSTIHIPIYSFPTFKDQDFNTINSVESPKILYYRKYPNTSFHLSWNYNTEIGYLIKGKNIINSEKIKIWDKKRKGELPVFNVSTNYCKKVIFDNLISTILEIINPLILDSLW